MGIFAMIRATPGYSNTPQTVVVFAAMLLVFSLSNINPLKLLRIYVTGESLVLKLLFYVATGVLVYSYILEDWTVMDSVYFSIATFSTVGYGDLTPSSHISKLFTIVYILWGTFELQSILGFVGEKVVTYNLRQMQRVSGKTQIKFVTRKHLCLWILFIFIFTSSLILALVDNEWDFIDICYFVIVTASTVGYGDLSAVSSSEKMFAIFTIPLVVGSMGFIIGEVTASKVEFLSSDNKKNDDGDKINYKESMDRLTFIQSQLVESGKVSTSEIEALGKQFDGDHNKHI